MLKKILFVVLFSSFIVSLWAQKVEFTVDGPRVTVVDSYFKVEFRLSEEPSSFEGPDFGDLEVVAGPIQSQMSSFSYSNGKSTSQKSFVYTYGLVAPKEGTYTIAPAKAVVDGRVYHTKPFPLEIAKERSSRSEGGTGTDGEARKSRGIAKDDILLRMSVNKSNVYKGEPLVATVKIYDRTQSIAGIQDAKIPAFNGFWKQELPNDNPQVERETFNGKVYQTQEIGRYLLFPQKSGVLEIEQMDLTIIARVIAEVPASARSVFDDFFSGGVTAQNVEQVIRTQPIKINVKELPTGAPVEFDGAVGEFAVECLLDNTQLNANSSGLLTLRLTGAGNMPLINAPKITLPSTFEVYPSKNSEKVDITSSGVKGYKQFEYPFIARAEGTYDIEPISFAYFDPKSESYKVVSTAPYKLEVLRDVSSSSANNQSQIVSGVTKEELKILGKDIRFIRIGSSIFKPINTFFVASPWYVIALIAISLLFVAVLLYLRKRIKEMRDTVRVKNKRANKVALRRLKLAGVYMKANKETNFYQEMLSALLGYVSDKLNIPVAELSKDNISRRMLERGVVEDDVKELLKVISDCEMAQYSPSESSQMSVIYGASMDLIGRIENKI